jgi:DNA-directed RNA polymerase specialized sigma24 family protein
MTTDPQKPSDEVPCTESIKDTMKATADAAAILAANAALHSLPPESVPIDEMVHVEGYPRNDLARLCKMTVDEIEGRFKLVADTRTALIEAKVASGFRMTSGSLSLADVMCATGFDLSEIRKLTTAGGIREPAREQKPELRQAVELALKGYRSYEISRKLGLTQHQVYNAIAGARGRGVKSSEPRKKDGEKP